MRTVQIKPLRLTVRPVISANVHAFVPIHAKPFQIGRLVFFAAGHVPFHVGIFNPNNEFPAVMSGKQIIKQRRSGVSDM